LILTKKALKSASLYTIIYLKIEGDLNKHQNLRNSIY